MEYLVAPSAAARQSIKRMPSVRSRMG